MPGLTGEKGKWPSGWQEKHRHFISSMNKVRPLIVFCFRFIISHMNMRIEG
jgi:hypothetical protein